MDDQTKAAAILLGYEKIEADIYIGEQTILLSFPDGSTKIIPISSKVCKDLHVTQESMQQLLLFRSKLK